MTEKIVEGKDAYGRQVTYEVMDGECDLCHKEKKVMLSNGSDGEYCSFEICKECFLKEMA